MALDDSLLQQYITRFCGYGEYLAPVWLVGMEEGSTGAVDEMTSRLNV